MEKRCWAARKRMLGKEHRDTLVSMSKLAWYYGGLGDSGRAAEMEKQCWAARKRVLGEDHPDTLVSMSSLAVYNDRLGDSVRAAEMEEQCWAARKRVLGEEHPDTLISLQQLELYKSKVMKDTDIVARGGRDSLVEEVHVDESVQQITAGSNGSHISR
jgi:hypothetical protein